MAKYLVRYCVGSGNKYTHEKTIEALTPNEAHTLAYAIAREFQHSPEINGRSVSYIVEEVK